MSGDHSIDEAIDRYEPAWLPAGDALRAVVVVIDPVGGGGGIARRRADDLALMTGAHLFHLVQSAGGIPVMTRADDRPMPIAEAGRDAALVTLCEQYGSELVVSIEFVPSGPPDRVGVWPLDSEATSRSVAKCVATTLDVPMGSAGATARPLSTPNPWFAGLKVCLSGDDEAMPARDRQTLHRRCAEHLYRGLASFSEAERGALDRAREARLARGGANAVGPVPRFVNRAPEQMLTDAARRIWPQGRLPIERAPWYCESFIQATLSNRSILHLRPQVTIEGSTVVMRGTTNIACLRDTLADALRTVGVENIRNEVRLLPEEGRLDERRFGICIASMAMTFEAPSEAAALQTQLLYGEPLLLLDHDAGYYLVHGSDGYWGWVRDECVRAVARDDFRKYQRGGRAVLKRDVELDNVRFVRGAVLPVASTDGARTTLMRPDGETFEVAADDVRMIEAAEPAQDRVESALRFLHRPYVFGAVSPLGLDCSGLVRNVCEQTGVPVGRDGAQQFLFGKLVATRWYRDDIRPGDFLFFVNAIGRIFHVGIAISATHFVHAAPPEVKINSLQPGDRLYCEYREHAFLGARRW